MFLAQRGVLDLYMAPALEEYIVQLVLATRDPGDLYRFVRMARGEEVALSDMGHAYSEADAAEIVAVLERLLRVQSVVLRVNQAYIASAATAAA